MLIADNGVPVINTIVLDLETTKFYPYSGFEL